MWVGRVNGDEGPGAIPTRDTRRRGGEKHTHPHNLLDTVPRGIAVGQQLFGALGDERAQAHRSFLKHAHVFCAGKHPNQGREGLMDGGLTTPSETDEGSKGTGVSLSPLRFLPQSQHTSPTAERGPDAPSTMTLRNSTTTSPQPGGRLSWLLNMETSVGMSRFSRHARDLGSRAKI